MVFGEDMNETWTYYRDRDNEIWKINYSTGYCHLYNNDISDWDIGVYRDFTSSTRLIAEMQMLEISKNEVFLDML